MSTDPSTAGIAPLTPVTAGIGLELSPEQWNDVIIGPLMAASAVLSLNLEEHVGYGPWHLPVMTAAALDDTAWTAPNGLVAEADLTTGGPSLLGHNVKALKLIARASAESVRSSIGSAVDAAHTAIINEMVKVLDKALIQGSAASGIVGLIAAAGGSVAYPGGVGSDENFFDAFQDGLTMALSNYAKPSVILINTATLGTIFKAKDADGRQLIGPALAAPSGPAGGGAGQVVDGVIMGRRVIAAPSIPVGTAILIDESRVHIGRDLDYAMKILDQLYASFDQVGFLVVTRFDIAVTNPFAVVTVTNLL